MKLWFKDERRIDPPEEHTLLKQQRLENRRQHRFRKQYNDFRRAAMEDVYIVKVEYQRVEERVCPKRVRTYAVTGIVLIPRADCKMVTERYARRYVPGGLKREPFAWRLLKGLSLMNQVELLKEVLA